MIYKIRTQIIFTTIFSLILSGCVPVLVGGVASSTVELAKDRTVGDALKDTRISMAIKTDLVKKGFSNLYTKIKVDVVQGRVIFTGCVSKEEDSLVAVTSAWSQNGVTEVINELKIDKKSDSFDLVQYTRDTMITSQIKSKTFLDSDIKFSNYTVITVDDVVYLFGIARSEEELAKVAHIASNVHGAQKVISHVRVEEYAKKIQPDNNAPDTQVDRSNQTHNAFDEAIQSKNVNHDDSDFLVEQGDTSNSKNVNTEGNGW